MMTMGSLFDSIGGFPLAARRNGIATLWASEIEPFPIRVTKLRFPEMVHLGDITKLDGAKLPPVDIICGGSPCQDLSVAGARAGLAGSRSGLFMEQIRITKEMRNEELRRGRATQSVRPPYFIWENVPGAFSSGSEKGKDFQVVLEETCRIADGTIFVPRPPSGRWEPAGAILGAGFSLAWRVLDAQYWPQTPQRRRRIFLVADLGGTSAPEILFEQGRLFGDTAESGAERQSPAVSAEGGPGTSSGVLAYINQREETINLGGKGPGVLCLNDQGGERMGCTYDQTATFRSQTRGHEPLIFDPADPPRLIRRLTPLECERLQGFPDGWTEIPGASDSARYRALGNSIAIPCVEYLFRGVAYFLGREAPFR